MRKIILALALFVSVPAFAQEAPAKKPRDTTTIKECGVQWKALKAEAKVNPTDSNVEKVAAGWPAYWSVCAKAHKVGA